MPSNQTFQKRQKEMARKERQREKAERKAQRKLEKQSGVQSDVETTDATPGEAEAATGEADPESAPNLP